VSVRGLSHLCTCMFFNLPVFPFSCWGRRHC